MLSEFEDTRQDIRKTRIIDKNYSMCINKCLEYLKQVNKIKNLDTKDDKWFIYHDLALNNKKLNNIDIAIKYEILAVNYTNHNINDCDYRYIYSLWLIAECYSLQGNKQEAITLYTQCSKRYKALNEQEQRICTVWNKAKILSNKKTMIKLISIYERKTITTSIKTHGDLEYDDVLKEMYSDLFALYLLEDRQKAFELLDVIKNKNLRKELGKKLEVA